MTREERWNANLQYLRRCIHGNHRLPMKGERVPETNTDVNDWWQRQIEAHEQGKLGSDRERKLYNLIGSEWYDTKKVVARYYANRGNLKDIGIHELYARGYLTISECASAEAAGRWGLRDFCTVMMGGWNIPTGIKTLLSRDDLLHQVMKDVYGRMLPSLGYCRLYSYSVCDGRLASLYYAMSNELIVRGLLNLPKNGEVIFREFGRVGDRSILKMYLDSGVEFTEFCRREKLSSLDSVKSCFNSCIKYVKLFPECFQPAMIGTDRVVTVPMKRYIEFSNKFNTLYERTGGVLKLDESDLFSEELAEELASLGVVRLFDLRNIMLSSSKSDMLAYRLGSLSCRTEFVSCTQGYVLPKYLKQVNG